MKNNLQLYLAPLHGLTDKEFRIAYYKHFQGFDYALSPFIPLVKGRKIKSTFFKDILDAKNEEIPLIPQLIGNDKEDFVFMASQLYNLGFEHIDWNLGCPKKSIAAKKRGSGLLPYPELIDELFDYVFPRINNQLSIKIRLGRKHSDEIDQLIPIFNSYPLKSICVHPRIGIQMFEGDLDMWKFDNIVDKITHPIIFNGDISHKQDIENVCKKHPTINAFMIGRAAMFNPELPEKIKGLKSEKPLYQRFYEFHDDLFKAWELRLKYEKSLLGKMKDYWFYFSYLFDNQKDVYDSVVHCDTIETYKHLIMKLKKEQKV